jgi:hypothetical protein
MMKNFVFFLFVSCLLACSSAKVSKDGFYGESFKPKKYMEFSELATKMNTVDSLNTMVKGRVESVCQKKGCWMNIVSDNGDEMFVKFKDYGFFMPLDLAGKEVVMNGYAFKDVTSVDELKHYAEDEGLSQAEIDGITEPKKELKFMASGVYLPN